MAKNVSRANLSKVLDAVADVAAAKKKVVEALILANAEGRTLSAVDALEILDPALDGLEEKATWFLIQDMR